MTSRKQAKRIPKVNAWSELSVHSAHSHVVAARLNALGLRARSEGRRLFGRHSKKSIGRHRRQRQKSMVMQLVARQDKRLRVLGELHGSLGPSRSRKVTGRLLCAATTPCPARPAPTSCPTHRSRSARELLGRPRCAGHLPCPRRIGLEDGSEVEAQRLPVVTSTTSAACSLKPRCSYSAPQYCPILRYVSLWRTRRRISVGTSRKPWPRRSSTELGQERSPEFKDPFCEA